MTRENPRYGERARPAFLPGLLGAVAAMAGLVFLGSDGYLIVLFAVAILALIIIVFAVQAKAWWWVPPLAAVAVLWNPILPFPFDGTLWRAAHVLAAAVFLAVALFLRTPIDPREAQRRR